MRLERVEEICTEFLRQTTNPLTPVTLLYEKCIQDPQVGDMLTLDALLLFLRGHGDIMVVDGLNADDPIVHAHGAAESIDTTPQAILKTRIPTRTEMADMMRQQMDDMRQRLLEARDAAVRHDDSKTAREIEVLLERMERLEGHVKFFHS